MIITVTPNPALDLTITVPTLARGETNRVPPATERAGGKGLNVARVLREQGYDSIVIAPVGSSDVDAFRSDLGDVASDLVEVDRPTRRSIAVVERDADVTTIMNERGYEQPADVWDRIAHAVERHLPRASCLVVSGSVPPGSPDDLVARYVSMGVMAGIPVIADATGPHLLAAARAGATVLKPNRHELAETVPGTEPVAGARRLQAAGAGLVLVSLGADGMIAVPRSPDAPVQRATLGRVLAGNPTGAGDAAVAAVATLIAAGEQDPAALLRRATAWSAAAVLMPVAGSIHSSHTELEHDVRIAVG